MTRVGATNCQRFESQFSTLIEMLFKRADQSHRIPSYQPDQLIEKHLHKKQCRKWYNAPSYIRINILLSVYLLHYTCTVK